MTNTDGIPEFGKFEETLVKGLFTKITCSPSSVDYRPKTNAVILLDIGHTKGRTHTGGIGQGKET
jgi:hypothetical protein